MAPNIKRKRTKRGGAGAEHEVLFHQFLLTFVRRHRHELEADYTPTTQAILRFNRRSGAWLRTPQLEALEIYIFLREACNGAPLHRVFADWRVRTGPFRSLVPDDLAPGDTPNLADMMELGGIREEVLEAWLASMAAGGFDYPNYIFALTMGTGKTLLMATCFLYEFANYCATPDDERFAANALVLAPDLTVLDALREMTTFNIGLVLPPRHANRVRPRLQFHFMSEADSLHTADGDRLQVVIANAQKIIVRRTTVPHGADRLFAPEPFSLRGTGGFADMAALLGATAEFDLVGNQRLARIARLERLAIYVDEAHHAFGQNVAEDMGAAETKKTTSLRATILHIGQQLAASGKRMVGCFNFTGTPYWKKGVFPHTVYAYGLRTAIERNYLKRVLIHSYAHIKSEGFVHETIAQFLKETAEIQPEGRRPEGRLPKLAFFAATIEELQKELRPAVERALIDEGRPLDSILINTQDSSDADIREFRLLDDPASTKQFILLVNKGKEGWNCRSLFGVALYRKPKSKVFVLQATMRCMRSIGDAAGDPCQYTAGVYLDEELRAVLETELRENFRETLDALANARGDESTREFHVKVVPPKRIVKVIRKKTRYEVERLREPLANGNFDLNSIDVSQLRVTMRTDDIIRGDTSLRLRKVAEEDISWRHQQSKWTEYTLTMELAQRLFVPASDVQRVIACVNSEMKTIVALVNRYNEAIEQVVGRLIPHFYNVFELDERRGTEEVMALVEDPPEDPGHYTVRGKPEFVRRLGDADLGEILRPHTFHVDPYVFDSTPERRFFEIALKLLREGAVDDVYFTGMLTTLRASRFSFIYTDPVEARDRQYFPDFMVRMGKNWWIVEIKAANQVTAPEVQAKANAVAEFVVTQDSDRFRYLMVPDAQCTEEWVRASLLVG